MFEKEAKEYTKENLCKECHNHCREGMCTCAECKKKTFKDGAEFGYNKAKEWHYVKDGDLPKENHLVMVYRVNPLGANIAITNWYDSYKDTKVIAWKEIVPPKGSEINDYS